MNELTRQTAKDQQPNRSHSYILRLWCTEGTETTNWHASLEDPFTRERLGFSSLEQLFAFLMDLSEGGRGER